MMRFLVLTMALFLTAPLVSATSLGAPRVEREGDPVILEVLHQGSPHRNNSDHTVTMGLDTDGRITAWEMTLVIPDAHVSSLRDLHCAPGTPSTHVKTCQVTQVEKSIVLLILVYSMDNTLLPPGTLNAGTFALVNTRSAPVVQEILASTVDGTSVPVKSYVTTTYTRDTKPLRASKSLHDSK